MVFVAVSLFWALLLIPFEVKQNKSFWDRLMDGSHFLLFGAVGLVMLWVLRKRPERYRDLGLICGALVVAVELIQPLSGRSFGVEDLVNGLLGVAAVVSGSYLWLERKEIVFRAVHFVCLLGALGHSFFPAWQEWQLVLFRQGHFPILGAFEDQRELSLWEPLQRKRWKNTSFSIPLAEVSISEDFVAAGAKNLRVETTSGLYSGVVFQAEGQDWSSFQLLSFQVYNPGAAFTLRLRIDDAEECQRYENRFNKQILLAQRVNQIQIPTAEIAAGPKKRELQLARIEKVFFFVGPEEGEKVFYLDDVTLSNYSSSTLTRSSTS